MPTASLLTLCLAAAVFQVGPRAICLTVEQLTKSSHADAIPELRNEVVLSPRKPSEEEWRNIASALHCDLSSAGGVYRLFRSDETRRRLSRDDTDLLASQARSVAKRIEQAGSETPFEAFRKERALFASSSDPNRPDDAAMVAQEVAPAGRLLATLLKGMDTATFSRAAPGKRSVFANDPVGTELPLANASAAIATYEAEQSRFAEWASKSPDAAAIDGRYRWFLPKSAAVRGSRTVRLTLDRRGSTPGFAIAVYGPSGDLESTATLSLAGFGMLRVRDSSPEDRLGTARLPKIALDELADDRSTPFDVCEREPLDGFVRSILCLYARAKGAEKVVSCVPDDLYRWLRTTVRQDSVDLDAVRAVLAAQNCETRMEGDTLLIRPIDPLLEEALRADREPLSRLYRCATKGTLDLAEIARYHGGLASVYQVNSMIPLIEGRIARACRLDQIPEWSLPHAVLTLLSECSPNEVERLTAGKSQPLDPSLHNNGLQGVAELVERAQTRLESTKNRLLATLATLESRAENRLLVKRVSKGPYHRVVDDNGKITDETLPAGSVFDTVFQPLTAILPSDSESDREVAASQFAFLWRTEHTVRFRVRFGTSQTSGWFAIRQPIATGERAVELGDLPGGR